MKTRNTATGPEPAVAPAPTRGRRAAWLALLLAATGGVAWATDGEKYPDYDDEGIEAKVADWIAEIPSCEETLCTGAVTRSDSQSTRDPDETTPNVPGWTPAGEARLDGSSVIEARGGGDTDDVGTDSFLFVRIVGLRANLFATMIFEAEDGAKSEWKVRYRGTETVAYENGPVEQGDLLEVTNPWSIGWTRRVIDFDARNGEFDEEKEIEQRFSVRCDLIDGSSVGDGAEFHRVVPVTMSSTTSNSLKLKTGAKSGDPGAIEGGVEAGFDRSTTRTYDTKFSAETSSSEPLAGVAKVTARAPCPDAEAWTIATEFSGDFSVVDHEGTNGDKGARQEFRLTVINEISSVRVSGCHACGSVPPPRDPPPPPPPTTPGDPVAPDPATPSLPSQPVTPADGALPQGPVITPRAGEEPGFAPESGMPVAPSDGPRPLVGPDDLPPVAPFVGPVPMLPPSPTEPLPTVPAIVPVTIAPVPAGSEACGSTDASTPR